jgi:DNA-binding PadR family transcriptional regulator
VSDQIRITNATLDVLEVLLSLDDELYGLRIAKEAGLHTGTVFPILARFERMGMVESAWETSEPAARGPRRRFYRLTPDGVEWARGAVAKRLRSPAGGRHPPRPQTGIG